MPAIVFLVAARFENRLPTDAADAREIESRLRQLYPGADIRMRETGRYIAVQVQQADDDEPLAADKLALLQPPQRAWRLDSVSVVHSSESR